MRLAARKLWSRLTSAPAAAPAPAHAPSADGRLRTVYDLFAHIETQRQPASFPDIIEPDFWAVLDKVRPHTMLTVEALYEIQRAVRYLVTSGVDGDLVECGVFMGGAVRAATEWAQTAGLAPRRFYLYDTFAGFPEGTAAETDLLGNEVKMYPHPHFRDVVAEVIAGSPWPQESFVFVEGDVAATLRTTRPERIALLRLDTDDYASTRAELEALYPLVAPGGVVMIDDYGHFRGARQATDEYFAGLARPPLLHRISYAVRSGVKPVD
ncbi:MAG: TylF/MycF/NovP-related O-methyltransferase [Vicinamibacteria bacterium]